MSLQIEHRLDRLAAEVQDLRHELKLALGHIPRPGGRWMTTGQFAAVLGLKGRCISNWIAQGRFPESVVKKRPRGGGYVYLLDRDPALAVAERILAGEA